METQINFQKIHQQLDKLEDYFIQKIKKRHGSKADKILAEIEES